MNNEHWYVLLTIRSKEEEVCKYLNENDGIYAFSPKMEFYHRVSKQIQQRALFGGYVFVVNFLKLKWMRSLKSFLCRVFLFMN